MKTKLALNTPGLQEFLHELERKYEIVEVNISRDEVIVAYHKFKR